MNRGILRRSRIALFIIVLIMVMVLTACSTGLSSNTGLNSASINPSLALINETAMTKAYLYLNNNFNPDLKLLCESPDDPNQALRQTYWLANDNLLASYALKSYDPGLSDLLTAAIEKYGYQHDHYIEILSGDSQIDPTRAVAHTPTTIENHSQLYLIKTEKLTDVVMDDYTRYFDKLCYKSLWYAYGGNSQQANALFYQARNMWDGQGFSDRPFQSNPAGGYNTYKLALFYLTARELGKMESVTFQDRLLSTLYGLQEANGGFHTFYSFDSLGRLQFRGSTNTETTSLVMLALK